MFLALSALALAVQSRLEYGKGPRSGIPWANSNGRILSRQSARTYEEDLGAIIGPDCVPEGATEGTCPACQPGYMLYIGSCFETTSFAAKICSDKGDACGGNPATNCQVALNGNYYCSSCSPEPVSYKHLTLPTILRV